jgi:hypothetical protein
MAHNTSRLGLPVADGGDNVNTYPTTVDAVAKGILDNAAIYQSGTLVLRPAVGSVAAGTFYYSTDTALLAYSNGTTWVPVGPTIFTGIGAYANVTPSAGRGTTSTVWAGDTTLVSGTMTCTGRTYALTFRASFIGIVITSLSVPIYASGSG